MDLWISCTITLAYPYSRTCHCLMKIIHTSEIAASVLTGQMLGAASGNVPGSADVCTMFVQLPESQNVYIADIADCSINIDLTSRFSAISRVFSPLLTTTWCHGHKADSPQSSQRCPVPGPYYWTSKRWEDFNSSARLRHHRESRDT
jgi:hypothetical protein